MARWLGVLTIFVFAAAALAQPIPPSALRGDILEVEEVGQADAEALFATSEAAIYFPELRQARAWSVADTAGRPVPRVATLVDFTDSLERDFPGFRSDRYGPWLMKVPHRATPLPASESAGEVAGDATVLTDSFEGGNLSQWALANNTNGEYDFTVMGCKAHNGTWSADAFRGGTKGMHLACWDSYPAGVTTQITHSTCDAIQGASQAWLDFYLTAEMDDSEAIGVYYLAADGYIYGYNFVGSWSSWFHMVVNLKQWNHVGDLTTAACVKLLFQFRSDGTATAGTGPILDDVTIRTDEPSFLRATIAATPSTGTAPLTVSFVPTVSGGSGTESYEWRFGDAASASSTSKNATFTYTGAGEYWPRFRVADSTGTRAYAHTKIVVSAGSGCSLSCTATAPAAATAGTTVSFQATASPTGCSGSATYLWSFGDGQVSSLQNPTHAYATAGTYSWSMTASVSGTTCPRTGTIAITASSTRTSRRRSVLPPGDTTVASQPVGPSGGTVSGGGVAI
ncbi:MAG: PKD domain-containing protein, partial [Thermoanaerobaculia bacterium]